MPPIVRLLALGALVFAVLVSMPSNVPGVSEAAPHTPMRLAGTGPSLTSSFLNIAPTVNGFISDNEWPSPISITLNGFNNSSLTRTAELYLAHTTTDLYVALVLADPTLSSADVAEINLDTNHDHTATAGGEDALRYEGDGSSDLYWAGSDWARDAQQNGIAKATFSSNGYVYEFRKPLNSGDPNDLAAEVGVAFGFRIQTWDAHTFEYYRYPTGSRGHGDVQVEWAKWADLTLSNLGVTVAPTPTSPSSGAQLSAMTTSLNWTNPPGTTQVQLQLVPSNNDGPGVNLILSGATNFEVPPPPGWYGLLPGMGYTWRVRATTKATFAPENDPTWGPWSTDQTFCTPVRDSSRIGVVTPTDGATVSNQPRTIQWSSEHGDVFYYEVQVSPDPNFGEQGAVSFVWHNLVHGGVSNPPNSWTTPALPARTTLYFRVRPRVQGDGTPVAWSRVWSFKTQ